MSDYTVQYAPNTFEIDVSPAIDRAQLDAHVISPTAHGLSTNISAALAAAYAPTTANEILTRQALTAGITFTKTFVSDAASDAVVTIGDTVDSYAGQMPHYLLCVKNNKSGWGADTRIFSIRRDGGVFAKDYLMVGEEASINLFAAMITIASDLDVNGFSLAAKNNSNGGPIFTFRGHAGDGTLAQSTPLLQLSATGVLSFGGFVSTAPALKARGAVLDVKLADESNYAVAVAAGIDICYDTGAAIQNLIRFRRPSDGFYLGNIQCDWDGDNGGKMYFRVSSKNNAVGNAPNLTGLAITSSATDQGVKLGFYGATPVILQTGVAVSAAGIHAALVALGLITA